MCGNYGYCNCDPEEMTVQDQMAFLEEKEKILEAKLATIRHLKDSLKTKADKHE